MNTHSNPSTKRGRFFLLAKISLMFSLILVLLIPTLMIRGLIHERESRQEEARQEIAQGWGGYQDLTGPILVLPYQYDVIEKQTKGPDKIITRTDYAYFLPESLTVLGNYTSKLLHRGIFNVPVYTGDLKISGQFKKPDLKKLKLKPEQILWDEAYLTLGISDLKGIRNNVVVNWESDKLPMGPEKKAGSVYTMSLQSNLPEIKEWQAGNMRNFALALTLAGSQSTRFIPVGKQSTVEIESNWPHPSFTGYQLPTERQVSEGGFSASWEIPQTGRMLPQAWKGKEIQSVDLNRSAFGVDFILPIDTYQFSERSVKYAVLFILLTFVAFFLLEILGNLQIHPIQYLLVGFALCLFYLLLLSLSEHLSFGLAYVVAATGTIGLITAYISQVLKRRRWALALAGVLSALYAYLYTLLRAEDFALLMGSLGLFLILGVIMFLTRKINWYAIGKSEAAPNMAPATNP